MNELGVTPLNIKPLRPEELPEPGPLLRQLGVEGLQRRHLDTPQLDVSPLSLRLMELRGLT